jgi:hypothetical protein
VEICGHLGGIDLVGVDIQDLSIRESGKLKVGKFSKDGSRGQGWLNNYLLSIKNVALSKHNQYRYKSRTAETLAAQRLIEYSRDLLEY